MYNYLNFPESNSKMQKDFSSLRTSKNILNPCIVNASKIIIYGAGYNGLGATRELRQLGVHIDGICDSNENLSGKTLCGVQIFGLKSLITLDKNTTIIITPCLASIKIEKMLREMGFNNLFVHTSAYGPHVALKFYSENCKEKQNISAQNKDKIDFVFNNLSDEHSKAVFNANMKLWLYGDYEEAINTRTQGGYYPHGIINLGKDEVFVDCGAYTGDSALEFSEKTNGNYRMIYAYEADELSYGMAKNFVKTKNLNNISINNIGVFSRKETLNFVTDDSVGNRIASQGETQIQVDSLDNLLEKRPYPVTYIKMDIEGAEMDALYGAYKIITEDSPKLAICVYHKFGDIWEIPNHILTHFPDYNIYIRNEYVLYDYVCFAVKGMN